MTHQVWSASLFCEIGLVNVAYDEPHSLFSGPSNQPLSVHFPEPGGHGHSPWSNQPLSVHLPEPGGHGHGVWTIVCGKVNTCTAHTHTYNMHKQTHWLEYNLHCFLHFTQVYCPPSVLHWLPLGGAWGHSPWPSWSMRFVREGVQHATAAEAAGHCHRAGCHWQQCAVCCWCHCPCPSKVSEDCAYSVWGPQTFDVCLHACCIRNDSCPCSYVARWWSDENK